MANTNTKVLIEIQSILKTIQNDVSSLKSDVSSLKSDVSSLKSDVASLVDWRKKLSVAEEEKFNKRLLQILSNCNSYDIKRIYLSNFVDSSGQVITDFDGCFIISSKLPLIKIPRTTAQEKRALVSVSPLRMNNSTSTNWSYLVIVETKLTIDKRIIDKKLEQMASIKNNIVTTKTQTTNPSKPNAKSKAFQTMVSTFDIERFPDEILLVFGCDSMSRNLCSYIDLINDGIDEIKYKSLTFDLLQEDRVYQELVSQAKKQKIKSLDFSSYDKIVNTLSVVQKLPDSASMIGKISHLQELMKPYGTIAPYLSAMKGNCGYMTLTDSSIPVIYCHPDKSGLQ